MDNHDLPHSHFLFSLPHHEASWARGASEGGVNILASGGCCYGGGIHHSTLLGLSDWTKVWLVWTYLRMKKAVCQQSKLYQCCGFKIDMQNRPEEGIFGIIRVGKSIEIHSYWNNYNYTIPNVESQLFVFYQDHILRSYVVAQFTRVLYIKDFIFKRQIWSSYTLIISKMLPAPSS